MINQSFETIVENFTEFFKDTNEIIPPISFTKLSDLNRFVQELSNVDVANSGNQSEFMDNLSKAVIELGEDPKNNTIINSLSNLSTSFASDIETAFSTITKDVDPIVEELKAKIQDQYIFNIKKEGAENLLEDDQDKTPALDNFYILKWENLNSPTSVNDVISTACSDANINKEELNKFNLSVIIEKVSFAGQFKHTEVSPEATKAATDALTKRFSSVSSDINDSLVKMFFSLLTSQKSYIAFCTNLKAKMKNPSLVLSNCIEFISLVTNFTSFGTSIKNGTVDLSNVLNQNTIDNVEANIDVVLKTCYAMEYYCLYQKNFLYDGKLILNKTTINNVEYEKYVTEGNSLENIYNFLKAMYPDRNVPINGISTSTVTGTNIADKLSKVNQSKEFQEKFIKSTALNKAFSFTCTDYVKDILNSNKEDNELSNRFVHELKESAQKVNRFTSRLQGKLEKIDDVLYEFVIHMNYEDTLVYTLYKKLGQGYINLAKAKTDIDEKDIFAANTQASIDLLLEYLINKLCK